MSAFLVALALILSVLTDAQSCETKETCDECIQEFECAWCTYLSVEDSSSSHCRPKDTTGTWCADILNVPKSNYEVMQNQPFSSHNESSVQITPQRIKLSLRKGQKIDVKFQYKSAENYPVDLYYLIDLSTSTRVFTQRLGDLGETLANTMRNFTSNFKLGYGSFIDKAALPFTLMRNYNLYHTKDTKGLIPTYSFKNHLPLTNDYKAFVDSVKTSKFSGNHDTPEGGFDALMQVMVCESIGWRPKARHLIVISTDAEYHIAGDGKLAGIVEPNPATCYDNKDDFLTYDYPSISQINYVAKENNINIIFAILSKNTTYDLLRDLYQKLSAEIENSKFDMVEGNTVVKSIVDNYKKIEQTVKFTSNATKDVEVWFSSTCRDSSNGVCNNVHVGETVDFTASIEAKHCLPDGQKTYISFKPEALNEGLVVELEVICECPCSSQSHPDYRPKSTNCSGVGDLRCGVCTCPKGRFGKQCECDRYTEDSSDVTNCIMDGTNEICSGLGECKCGMCQCPHTPNGRIYGQYCQCNDFSCKKKNGLLCSGNGKCNCNTCDCGAGYVGGVCDCPDSDASCKMADAEEVCSGRGTCKCGECRCHEGYSGDYCQVSNAKEEQDRCSEYQLCIECKVYQTGFYKDNCDEHCKDFVVAVVEKLDDEKENDTKTCNVSDRESCRMHFDYYPEENGTIYIEVVRECVQVDFFAWIVGVPLATLLLGFLMLIAWKIAVTVHDTKEFAKFEKERQDMRWHNNENPLYKEASTTFANPWYRRSGFWYRRSGFSYRRLRS